MRKASDWMAEYGESHQNKINKLIHWFCVPAIAWTVVGFFSLIPMPDIVVGMFSTAVEPFVHWGSVFVLLTVTYYAILSITIAIGMVVFSAGLLLTLNNINMMISLPLWQILLIVFIVAWIFQFVGHKIEGKKPSFFQDIQFLLVGPMWLLGYIYRKIGIRYA